MNRSLFFLWTIFCLLFCCVLGGQSWGEVVSVVMESLPESRIDASLTVMGMSDSDTTTVTGTVEADLDLYFDAGMGEVADINSIQFTGGQLNFSDMSFNLLFGAMVANATGVGGRVDSPYGAGAVMGNIFDTIDHMLILDQGVIHAAGMGEEMTIDLAVEPMALSGDETGSVSVVLESLDGDEATYSVELILPIEYDEVILDDGTFQVNFGGSGVVTAYGYFVRTLCPLRADLAWGDCLVDGADLAVFAEEWLAYGDVEDCGLAADLSGGDCYVDMADFAVVANEWLGNGVLND